MRLVYKRLIQLGGLCVLAGGAAAAVVWQEQVSQKAAAGQLSAARVMGFSDADAVQSLQLVTPHETFLLSRDGQGENTWRITAPQTTAGEATTVDALVRAVLDLRGTAKVGGDVAPAAHDLSLFSLAPARYSVTLRTRDGHAETLLVGKKNSFDGSMYVKRLDAPAVHLVPGTFEYQVDKDLYKLREKRLVACDGDGLKNFTVTPLSGVPYTLERRDEGFWLKSPLDTLADDAEASGIAQALCGLRGKTFVREHVQTDELKRFGLETPRFRVVLTEADGQTHAVRLGLMTLGGEAHYFAKPEGDGPVVELASDWAFQKLEIAASALRDMHVLAIDREAVQGVSLYHAGQVLTFVRRHDTDSGIDSWQMTRPKDSPAQSAKVATLVYKLWNLKAERILDEAPSPGTMHSRGLEDPELKVELTGKHGESLGGIAFSAATGDERFVTTDKGLRIDVVRASIVDDIATQASDYQEEAAAAKD